jgi:hypothetical protein
MKAAVIRNEDYGVRILYKGRYEACIEFIRILVHQNCDNFDLRYLNEDGSLGRLASWVL